MAVKGIDASYYTVGDVEKMTAFYSAILGEPTTRMDRISEWTFADDTSFGLYQVGGYDGPSSGSVMFAVDDVEDAARQARAAGAEIDEEHGTTDTPFCTMIFAADPEGNQFILHKRKT